MIRRQRKATCSADVTYLIQSDNDNRIQGKLPTTLIVAPRTGSNGCWFYVDVPLSRWNRKSDNYNRRRRKKLTAFTLCQLSRAAIIGIFYCFCSTFYLLSTYSRAKQRLPVDRLSTLNHNFSIIFPPQRYQLSSPRQLLVLNNGFIAASDTDHDFGGLKLRFREFGTSQNHGRVVYHDSHEDAGYEELWDSSDDDGDMEYYYAFDDDEKRNPLVMYDDPEIHLKKKCRRTNWHRQHPITCNSIHEFDFRDHVRIGDTKYLGYVCFVASFLLWRFSLWRS